MEPKLHRRVQRYGWDLAVAAYDAHWVPVLRTCSERVIGLIDPQPGESVWMLLPERASQHCSLRIASAPMAACTRRTSRRRWSMRLLRRVTARGINQITAERMDAEELAYPDASFDAAMCVLGLMYPADPQRAIDQLFRVTKPGGRVAVCVWGRRDHCGWREIFPIIDARVSSDVCPMFFSLGRPGALDLAFEQAGFVERHEERVSQSLHWLDERDACNATFPGGPVALPYSKMTPDEQASVEREFVESIVPYRNADGSYDVEGEFVFMLARKP